MNPNACRLRVATVLFVMSVMACGCGNPVQPSNHNPVVLSLAVFPAAIDPGDSAIVICEASDPDGDSLRYDWFTDGTLDIRGEPSVHIEYNTTTNYEVFYHSTSTPDTTAIRCEVRDLRGGLVGRYVWIILR